MADDSPQKNVRSKEESEIWDAIGAFEKIIEALPNDHISIEALAVAYEQVGDHDRAKHYAIRLANLMLDEGDEDAAMDLAQKIRADPGDPEVSALLKRIQDFRPEKIMAVVEEEDAAESAPATEGISDELAFAWSLRQAGKLSQEDYSNVVHDLTENSARSDDNVISTLHVLNDRVVKNMSDILAYVADECGTPVISLSCFDIHPAVSSMVPLRTMVSRKMLPFETMGNDLLLAVLNPYDTELQGDVEKMTGRICHLFLVEPGDFDLALDKVRQTLEKVGKDSGAP